VYEFLAWIEGSALGHAIRGSGVWTYGVLSLIHILGVATLFGAVLVLDLRLLGAWRRVPLSSIATPTIPIARAGFAVAAGAGICLLSTNATDYLGNPFFYAKFPIIALAMANAAVVSRLPAWRARHDRQLSRSEEKTLAVFGGLSLATWLAAVGAGRLIGYW
jgi:hypothetical protein